MHILLNAIENRVAVSQKDTLGGATTAFQRRELVLSRRKCRRDETKVGICIRDCAYLEGR